MEDRGSWTSILGRGPWWPPARCGSHGPLKCFAVLCVAFDFPWNAGNHDIAQETRGGQHTEAGLRLLLAPTWFPIMEVTD